MPIETIRTIILSIGWPLLFLGSFLIIKCAIKFYKAVEKRAIGRLVLAVSVSVIVSMYCLGIVSTIFMYTNPKEGIHIVSPVFLTWFVLMTILMKKQFDLKKEAEYQNKLFCKLHLLVDEQTHIIRKEKRRLQTSASFLRKKNTEIAGQNQFLEEQKMKIRQMLNTVREEKSKAIHESKKLDTVLKSIADGVFVLNNKGIIILANKQIEALSGYRGSEIHGHYYTKTICLLSEKDLMPQAELIETICRKGKTSFNERPVLRRKDGSTIAVAISAATIFDDYGKKVGCVVVIRDVTRENEVDRMKSEFVSVASHQLRTPLTGIKWFLELLLQNKVGRLTVKQKDFIRQIFRSNERVIHLVETLLNVSRIETGRNYDIVLKETDIIQMIKSIMESHKIFAMKRHVKIIFSPSVPKSIFLNLDEEKMRQAIGNLLTNAIKYSRPQKGKIEIGFETAKKKKVVLYIKDNGIGIPEGQQEKIFRKFFRADNAISKETVGTGLGLYIVKAIVEGHGGRVWFKSDVNKGTTFYIALPKKTKE